MTIKEARKKGQAAIMLENDRLAVCVLKNLGGKIAGLYAKNEKFELAAEPSVEYGQPVYGDDFSTYDASGFDDCFPNIHPCKDLVSGFNYPDHGEIWQAQFSVDMATDSINLHYASSNFPYYYEKKICLSDQSLSLTYRITNTGSTPFPCIWAFHELMRYEKDMEILYPKGSGGIINTLDSVPLGKAGRRYSMHGEYDFSSPPAPYPPTMIKYYLAEKTSDGYCGFWYPSANTGCLLRYDPDVLPYLGVWISAGGFRGDYNCALEPCNGFYDDIGTARNNNALYILEPDRPLDFDMTLEVINNKPNAR